VDKVRVVFFHDLVHIEDDAVLLGEDTGGADAGTGGTLLVLSVKVATGLSSTTFLAGDTSNEPWLDLCHYVLQ
jgi:hypothetical protein